jgi:hypothetical protein
MHHAEVAIRVAELLDRAGYLLLGERRGSVNAQVRLVGKGSSLIRLAVGGEEFAIVVGSGRPRPCRIPPVILRFPEPE